MYPSFISLRLKKEIMLPKVNYILTYDCIFSVIMTRYKTIFDFYGPRKH